MGPVARPQMGKLRHRAGDGSPEWKASERSPWSRCSTASGQQDEIVLGEECQVVHELIKQQRGDPFKKVAAVSLGREANLGWGFVVGPGSQKGRVLSLP